MDLVFPQYAKSHINRIVKTVFSKLQITESDRYTSKCFRRGWSGAIKDAIQHLAKLCDRRGGTPRGIDPIAYYRGMKKSLHNRLFVLSTCLILRTRSILAPKLDCGSFLPTAGISKDIWNPRYRFSRFDLRSPIQNAKSIRGGNPNVSILEE